MDFKDQINSITEKKKNRYSKSFQNRNRFSNDRFYIEGKEIINLLSLIEKKFETTSGWNFNFLESISEKIYKLNGDRLFLSDKQVEKIEMILFEDKSEDESLGFLFKKVNTQRRMDTNQVKSEILERLRKRNGSDN